MEGGSGLGLGSVRLEDLRGGGPGGPGVGGPASSFGGTPNPGGLGAPKAGFGAGFGGGFGGLGRPVSNTLHAPIAVNSFGTPSLSGSSFGQKGADLNQPVAGGILQWLPWFFFVT